MVAAMDLARDRLPPDTKMFGAHDYSVKNMEFGLKVDPNNQMMKTKKKEFEALRARNMWTPPTLLSEEKVINVFMRSKDADMMRATGQNNAADCMGFLRTWKTKNVRPRM